MMSQVPDDLADVVHLAASSTREYPVDVDGIEQRWRRRRRRRAIVGAAVVAVLVALSLGAAPVLGRGDGGPAPAASGHTLLPVVAAQRLMIQGYEPARSAYTALAAGSGPHGVAGLGGAALEVRPDGTIAHWALQRMLTASQVVGLPDGRVVALGEYLSPPMGGGMLMVVTPTGSGDMARNVGNGVPPRLIGATGETAYLWRAEGLAALNWETGEERVLADAAKLGGDSWATYLGQADVLGDLVLTSGVDRDRCALGTLDLRTGATARHRVTRGACLAASLARISPDQRLAAVTYLPDAQGPARLAVVDLASGVSLVDQAIDTPGDPGLGLGPAIPVGVAWLDAQRVRVAVAAAPDTKRVYRLEEALHVRTFDAG
jgi:hypothetical protein